MIGFRHQRNRRMAPADSFVGVFSLDWIVRWAHEQTSFSVPPTTQQPVQIGSEYLGIGHD
jgi:hypothetical protein